MQVPDKHGMHKYADTPIHTHPSTHTHTLSHTYARTHTYTLTTCIQAFTRVHTQNKYTNDLFVIYQLRARSDKPAHQIVVQLADTLIMRYQLYLNILCAWRYVRAWNTLLNLQGKGGDTKGLIHKGTYFNHRNNGVRTLAGNCVDPLPPPLRGKREQPCAHISWRIPSDTQLLHPPGRSIRVAAA